MAENQTQLFNDLVGLPTPSQELIELADNVGARWEAWYSTGMVKHSGDWLDARLPGDEDIKQASLSLKTSLLARLTVACVVHAPLVWGIRRAKTHFSRRLTEEYGEYLPSDRSPQVPRPQLEWYATNLVHLYGDTDKPRLLLRPGLQE